MDIFLLRVLLSFIVGGLYVAGIIWVSEKSGSRLGGIIAGVPSTILISLVFISWTGGSQAAQKAALVIPIMIAVSLVYVYVFTKLAQFGHEIATIAAAAAWLLLAILIVRLNPTSITLNTVIGVSGMLLIFWAIRDYPKHLKGITQALRRTHAMRAISAGLVIAVAVVAARMGGPVWGGAFAAFPATFASTLYLLNKSQGCEFTKAFTRQLPLSVGSTLVFTVVFYLSILQISIVPGFLVGMITALMYVWFLQKMTA